MTAHNFTSSQTSAEQKITSRILAAQCILCTHAVALQPNEALLSLLPYQEKKTFIHRLESCHLFKCSKDE